MKEEDNGASVAESGDEEEIEIEPKLSNIIPIFTDLICNRNLLMFVSYVLVASVASAIPRNVMEVYLTSDLGFAKESLAFIDVFMTPLNIVLAIFSSYLVAEKHF